MKNTDKEMESLKKEIAKRLIGMKIEMHEYTDELILALYGLDVAVNTVDFDYDRIYKLGYDEIGPFGGYVHNWDDYYICSLDVTFLEDEAIINGIID